MNRYQTYKEASFTDTYRRREVNCILSAVSLYRSVQVIGFMGMGKTNLQRFLVTHPQVILDHPDMIVDNIHLLYIDCFKLSAANAKDFFRECLYMADSSQVSDSLTDEFGLFKRLEQTLFELSRDKLIIMVIDRAERLCEAVDQSFFDQLRSLRDGAHAGQMVFILGSHRPLGRLYSLDNLVSDLCWVGPLADEDRAEFFDRHASRLQITISDDLRDRLWKLTGGHPGLLKNSIEWIRRQDFVGAPNNEQLCQELLTYLPIQRNSQNLWDNLDQLEQEFLLSLSSRSLDTKIPPNLQKSGLVVEHDGTLSLFSSLWAAYLTQNIFPAWRAMPMEVELDSSSRKVALQWQGQSTEVLITRKLVFELLKILASDPDRVFGSEELIAALYGEEALETYDDSLFQLVAALRKSLDAPVKKLCPDMTASCIQNIRGVGYKLIVDLPTG